MVKCIDALSGNVSNLGSRSNPAESPPEPPVPGSFPPAGKGFLEFARPRPAAYLHHRAPAPLVTSPLKLSLRQEKGPDQRSARTHTPVLQEVLPSLLPFIKVLFKVLSAALQLAFRDRGLCALAPRTTIVN